MFRKSNDDLEIITIMVLCCKHLMNTKAGKDGIIGSMGAVEALGDARNYVSDVNQVVVFELLAALCLWSEAAHSYVCVPVPCFAWRVHALSIRSLAQGDTAVGRELIR